MVSRTNHAQNTPPKHPGITLEEKLSLKGMLQVELAKRTGITAKTINLIIKGTAPISPETAMRLDNVLDEPADFWLNLEAKYQAQKLNTIKAGNLESELPFLEKINFKEMIKKGWINKKETSLEQLKALYSFFGVSSVNQLSPVWSQLEVNYRTSTKYKQNHFNIMAWLRQGEIKASEIPRQPYNLAKFKESLKECRKLTDEPFDLVYVEMQKLCANAGVTVVFIPELKGVATSGAAHWLDKDTALIQLSLRGKRNDMFWFNFFHEAGHIILHGRKEQFIDNQRQGLMSSGSDDDESPYFTEENKLKEAEADEFSGDFLIPRKSFSQFVLETKIDKNSIQDFALSVGVSPGIVVGQLQSKGYLDWHKHNSLKKTYDFPPNMM
ncbi:MAG: HigA family addiction module antidote protein [Methylophaga sp.]|nr:HigA family addiction module antidote protein [Methylophaga sp.]